MDSINQEEEKEERGREEGGDMGQEGIRGRCEEDEEEEEDMWVG